MENMVDPHHIFTWIEQKEPSSGKDAALEALNVAWASLETDAFLQSTQSLKEAFSELVEKHATRD